MASKLRITLLNVLLLISLTCYGQVYYTVTKVIDGDTFQIETGERVRLLGIDTPEKWESNKLDKDSERTGKDKETIKQLGKLASDYSESILLNTKVQLLPDSTNSDTDRYGRLLRYAYLEDGTFFNLKIIQDGYAYAYTKYPFIFMSEFVKSQKEAMLYKKGLWHNSDY